MPLSKIENYIPVAAFKEALACVQSGKPIVFIYGKAGTGKSTFTKNELANLKGNTVFLSPTGIAALNIGGQTLHSFFNLEHGMQYVERIKESRQAEIYQKLNYMVIDEISMVRADLMDAVNYCLQLNRKSAAPFGGVQVILIGDLYQLPPVVKPDEKQEFTSGGRYLNRYFFNSRVIREAVLNKEFAYIKFTEIFRQSDGEFIKLLEDVREGGLSPESQRALNQRVRDEGLLDQIEDVTILTCTNEAANAYNSSRLNALAAEKRHYEATIEGKFSPEDFPTLPLLTLKVGAKIIFIRNDSAKVWVNGTTGVIKELNDDELVVEIRGHDYVVTRETWEKYQYQAAHGTIERVVVGKFIQFPVKLGWALTIHKSQGLTLNNIYLDIGRGTFDSGQIYVALSRVRRIENIYLKHPIANRHLFIDAGIKKFLQYIERFVWGRSG